MALPVVRLWKIREHSGTDPWPDQHLQLCTLARHQTAFPLFPEMNRNVGGHQPHVGGDRARHPIVRRPLRPRGRPGHPPEHRERGDRHRQHLGYTGGAHHAPTAHHHQLLRGVPRDGRLAGRHPGAAAGRRLQPDGQVGAGVGDGDFEGLGGTCLVFVLFVLLKRRQNMELLLFNDLMFAFRIL